MTELGLPPIEHRYADVKIDAVDVQERLITVVAVPYEQPATVEYRSELWQELFLRGAFDGVAASPHRVRVNRDHDKSRTVGKAMQFWPDHSDGLVAEIRIAKTSRGDDTLGLAVDDCLSASVGFGVKPQDQELDRRSMTRRIKKAYLDHIAFVESPPYDGARVISLRDNGGVAAQEPLRTPYLDEFIADPNWRWLNERLNTQ